MRWDRLPLMLAALAVVVGVVVLAAATAPTSASVLFLAGGLGLVVLRHPLARSYARGRVAVSGSDYEVRDERRPLLAAWGVGVFLIILGGGRLLGMTYGERLSSMGCRRT